MEETAHPIDFIVTRGWAKCNLFGPISAEAQNSAQTTTQNVLLVAIYRRTIAPFFITKLTRVTADISLSGLPGTATISA